MHRALDVGGVNFNVPHINAKTYWWLEAEDIPRLQLGATILQRVKTALEKASQRNRANQVIERRK